MRVMLLAVVVAAVATGCSHGKPNAKPDVVGNQGSGTAAPADAAAADASACVATCVRQNQMRAVGPELIEADCRRACGEGP